MLHSLFLSELFGFMFGESVIPYLVLIWMSLDHDLSAS
ncbi:hypothetical protein Syn8016DRAFT_1508 [Synechococcus sp. WH 8016]|nr:hypothetical protein Syn8016DRAFT_1508 [Synechococcus sp. WH 8016]